MNQKKNKKQLIPETCFLTNIKLLKRRFPHLAQRLQAKNNSSRLGQPIDNDHAITDRFQKTKFLFYRDNDPIISAKEIIHDWHFKPYDTLFLIGMGLGYLPIEALKSGIGNPRMVIIEPSIQIFNDSFTTIDLSVLLTNDRVDLFVGEDISIADIVRHYKENIPVGKTPIIVHPNYDTLFGETIRSLSKELAERIREVKDAWFTIREHGQLMFKNTVTNLPSLFAGTPMRQLKGKLKGIPALCISAGPSLDESLADIKALNNRALIIACDSAASALLTAGIKPHFVVTVDIFKTNIDKLKPYFEDLREIALIFGLESNPDNVRLFLGPRRVGVSAYSKLMSFWLDPQLKLQSLFPEMSSVSHLALFSALAMEADPIVMVGMDMAYIQGKSHSFGSAFFHSIDNKKTVPVYGNTGCTLPTTNHFVADRLLIENITEKESVRFVNTCIGGAYVAGTEIKRISEVIDLDVPANLNVDAHLENIEWSGAAGESTAKSELKMYINLLDGVRTKCSHHKRAIYRVLHNTKTRNNRKADINYCLKAEKEFKAFEQQHLPYKSMNKEVMLYDFQKITKQREVMLAKHTKDQGDQIKDRFELLNNEYDVFEKGLDFQIQEIKRIIIHLEKISEVKNQSDRAVYDGDTHLQLARYYVRCRELWQASREYQFCIDRHPKEITPYLELAKAYIDSELWSSARVLAKNATFIFGNLPEIQKIDRDISSGIDAIFESMKNNWMQGDIYSTRKILAEYMTLRPEDPQAIELKTVIGELDREFAGDCANRENGQTKMGDLSTRTQQVVAHVKKKQLEKGVGILEGMYQDFPENRVKIREQIGDIRMMQKDYRSALWNYQQVMEIDPSKIEIKNKIDRIMPKLNA